MTIERRDFSPVAACAPLLHDLDEFYDRLETVMKSYLNLVRPADAAAPVANITTLVEQAAASIEKIISDSRHEEQWLYFRVSVPHGAEAHVIAREIGPLLNDLTEERAIQGWWWLRKHDVSGPALRVRVLVSAHRRPEVHETMRRCLLASQREFTILRYEPEIRLFGGAAGIKSAHDHFCADSAFLAAWARLDNVPSLPVIPAGLSLAFIIRMLVASGLDLFERWDVFDRVYDKRKTTVRAGEDSSALQSRVDKIIASPLDNIFHLFDGERRRLIVEHAAFLDGFANRISSAYFEGRLECGLREFFVPTILFHWNRIGMTALGQFSISRAACGTLARLTRKGSNEPVRQPSARE